MKALLRRKTIIRSVLMFFGFVSLVIFGQQCAKVQLEKYEEVNFASIGESPFRLDPPVEYSEIRRIIFMVDMSQSMISGPCVQDVDEGIGFTINPYFSVYDPNKGTGSSSDNRANGIDCQVNPNLPIARSSVVNSTPNIAGNPPTFLQTHLGIDHEAVRVGTVKKWITDSLASNPKLLINNTKIMILPVSGGVSQTKLEDKWKSLSGESPFQFFNISANDGSNTANPKLMNMLTWLQEEHDFNLGLSKSDDVWRYEKRTMGTSAAGSMFSRVYQIVQNEMRDLNTAGRLSSTDFQVIHLTDGVVTPIGQNISDVLATYQPCAACKDDPKKCTTVSLACGTLAQRMFDAWGYPEDNTIEKIDFFTGLLESLPYYFGNGYLKLDFVQLRKQRLLDSYPGKNTYFSGLGPSFEARKSRLSIWPLDKVEPPFRLIGDASLATTYKITNFFILNTNIRPDKTGTMNVDSDGDGLFDDQESALNLDPRKQRTNGYCLDSFMAEPAFAARCTAMAKASSCDPSLDSDGDSLNECEENLLGTSQFDFDTDGDSIPDSLEWIYGYNPLYPDDKLDSNGDGYLNTIQFAAGIGPQNNLKDMQANLNSYEVNFQGYETLVHPLLGKVMLELYQVLVNRIAVKVGLGVNAASLPPLYTARVTDNDTEAKKNNFIPYEQRILSVISGPERNTLTAIGRMIDVANPERAYWRLFKTEMPLSGVYSQPQLDLSQFKMIRARDRSDKQ